MSQRWQSGANPQMGQVSECMPGGWCEVHGDIMRGFVVMSQGGLWWRHEGVGGGRYPLLGRA